jgi:tetratricopeptide (TPR) repeat protein
MRFMRGIKDRRDPVHKKLADRISLLSFFCLIGLFGTVFCVALGWTRLQIYLRAQPEVQTISCAALCKQGPGKNVHIELTAFDYGSRYYAQMEKDVDGKDTGSWTSVFLSAFPKGRADDPTAPIVIVRSSKIENSSDMTNFKMKQALQGLVVDGFEDCTKEGREILKQYRRPASDYKIMHEINTDMTTPERGEILTIAGFLTASLACLGLTLTFAIPAYRQLTAPDGVPYILPASKIGFAADESYETSWQRCVTYLRTKRMSDAIEALTAMVVKFPERAEPRALLAQILPREQPEVYFIVPPYWTYTRQRDSPLGLCREALAMAPENAYPHMVHGQLLRLRKRYKEAQQAIEEALRINPEYYDALIEAGLIALEIGDFDRLSHYCDMGLRLRPNEYVFLHNKALSLWKQRRLPQAAELMDQALAAEPNKAIAHINRGAIAKDMKQNEVALQHFKIALRLDPLDHNVVDAVALAVPNRPLGLQLVRLLMITAGHPYFITKELLKRVPILNKLRWKYSLYALVTLYPAILLGLWAWIVPSAREPLAHAYNMAVHNSPMNGLALVAISVLLVPWIPYCITLLIFKTMTSKIARAELRK